MTSRLPCNPINHSPPAGIFCLRKGHDASGYDYDQFFFANITLLFAISQVFLAIVAC